MVRSLHIKLVIIFMLLIISLMAITGTFLINSTVNFYLEEFSSQMSDAFSDSYRLVSGLREAAAAEDAPERMRDVLAAFSGILGIDAGNREYYILDGQTGAYITGSDEDAGAQLDITPNILTALNGQAGYARRITDPYMDVAVPINGGDHTYIVYIKDSKGILQNLTMQLFIIILEALIFGVLTSVILGFLLSKTMTSPIEELTRGAKRIAAGRFDEKIEVHSHDEIGVLTRTFNNMSLVLKQTLEAIADERNKLNTLFLHMTDGVVAFTRGGRLLHVNPAARYCLQKDIDESMGFSEVFGDIVSLEQLRELRQPDFKEADYKLGQRDLKLFFAPFGGEEGEGGIMAVIRDITEQMHTEQVRREFVANVSHELRTPLTNIKSYAETLAEDGEIPRQTAKEFLGVILNEVDRMTRIVKDLLTLSRLDYDKMDWHLAPFSPGASLRSVCKALTLEAQRREQTFTLEGDGDLPDMLGDSERIEQVFMNIIANAIKYTPEKGTVAIQASATEELIRVTVSDTGIGIPKKDVARLFERFYRVDKARTRESGGTGLGLAIAQEIVAHHGGKIEVDSTVGKGTTMTVLLPLKPPAEAEA